MASNQQEQGGGDFNLALQVTEPPKLDIETYIQNYTGSARYARLLHIGLHSTILRVEALKAAVAEAKKGRNILQYLEAQAALHHFAPNEPDAERDEHWVDSTEKQNKAEAARLEKELKAYKNNLIKESIRMGNEDCGKFYQSIGNLQKAYEAYFRMRQDAVVDQHVIELNRHLADVCVEQKNWIGVLNHASKIQALAEPSTSTKSKGIRSLASVYQGLAYLAQQKYSEAAAAFLGAGTSETSTYKHIVSANDVAVYGGLCALATMNREQLQQNVLSNPSFRTYLELEPQVRRAIGFFVGGRYSACLSILEGYRNDYLLDIYLFSNVSELFRLIRSKSIVQYFIPFSCVTLESLNESFARPGETIEEELVAMIKEGTLNARIDTINGTLNAVIPSPRAEIQKRTVASVRENERELRRRILRMSIVNAGLELKGPKKQNRIGDFEREFLAFQQSQNQNQQNAFDPNDVEMGDDDAIAG